MQSGNEILDQHAKRRRELMQRAAGAAASGPAVALLLEGVLIPKRAAAYTVALANCGTAGVVTTAGAVVSTT